ncbi:hypothetical protein K7432_005550 [Basidiobolus ranarum]|uniref:Uncharacterized protein n=1 Tax=Basidiobolus ranarum TaxID=34480 RepID=A0ABR2W2Z5_9FUNG
MSLSPHSSSPEPNQQTSSSSYQPVNSHPYVGSSYQQNFDAPEIASRSMAERIEEGGTNVNRFETSVNLRMDIEAALAYVLFCFSGVLLLIVEQKNDYVRFHAWQSSIAFGVLFVIQFIIGFISTILWWILMISELGLAAFLAYRAYVDSATLERYLLPYVGTHASHWVDNE